ncbi:hypothetical protein [Paenibacillus psychroresistens]|uniref:hypothetical protein n=1 Tax=Paenibacillus psychroresistens TaxID=1778678 RepID=UPI0012DAD199|nr:hypothetical protein [Paenibacillus psychroresistens]
MENFIGKSFKHEQYLNEKHLQYPQLNNYFQLNIPSFNNPFVYCEMSLSDIL